MSCLIKDIMKQLSIEEKSLSRALLDFIEIQRILFEYDI